MKNPYMKFQNPSMYGLEVMLCIKKRNGRTHGRTDGHTHKRPRSNMPLQLLRSWGHKKFKGYLSTVISTNLVVPDAVYPDSASELS